MSDYEDMTVLVVDDDKEVLDAQVKSLLTRSAKGGWKCAIIPIQDSTTTLDRIAPTFAGVIITDVFMRGLDGLGLLRQIKSIDSEIPVILITARDKWDTEDNLWDAVGNSFCDGALKFLSKPLEPEKVAEAVKAGLDFRRGVLATRSAALKSENGAPLIGSSSAMSKVRQSAIHASGTGLNILITGNTGTGKEGVARLVHASDAKRRDFHLCAESVAALPQGDLGLSILFGHVKGSFTGATADHAGLLEIAHKGTLFLDEIGEASPELQKALLRAFQEMRVRRVGSSIESDVLDFRVIAATNKDIGQMVRDGTFREDLYYRVCCYHIHLPPLHEREKDSIEIFRYFADRLSKKKGLPRTRRLSVADEKRILSHGWPGGVRELQTSVEFFISGLDPFAYLSQPNSNGPETLSEWQEYGERRGIQEAMAKCGTIAAAAAVLGISEKTLYNKRILYGIRSRGPLPGSNPPSGPSPHPSLS